MQPKKLVLVAVVLLPLTVFWQTRHFDFVWDDESNILNNRYLNPVTAESVLRFWHEPYERLYVPLTYTVWALSAGFAGRADNLSPKIFHMINVVLHVVGALVVFALLNMLIRHDWAAGAGALLFALHPLQVEAVAWITGLKDILSGCLSLVALWQYLLYARANGGPERDKQKNAKARESVGVKPVSQSGFHYAAATGAFILAMLAKPSAVVTPAIALVLDRWVIGRSWKNCAWSLSIWLAIALPFIIATRWVQAESELEFVTSLWARPLVAADALAFYLYKLLVPFWLSPDYGRLPHLVLQGKWSYFTWLLPCAAAALLYFFRRRGLTLIVSGAIFTLGIMPVSGLLPFSFQNVSTVADRYVYLSMLGPALAACWLISRYQRPFATVASVLVLVILAIASAVQAGHWRSNEALFNHALRLNPQSWTAYYSLGRALAKKGDTAGAIASFREAARLRPEFTNAHFSLGSLLSAKGVYGEAVASFRKALSIAPHFVEARLGLINALIALGDLSGASKEFDQVLKLVPDRADVYFNLANLNARMGDFAEAARNLERAIRVRPDLVIAHNQLGRILASQGELARAVDHFRTALRIDPGSADAHENLALALTHQGKAHEAARHAQEAQRLRRSQGGGSFNPNRPLR